MYCSEEKIATFMISRQAVQRRSMDSEFASGPRAQA